MAAFLSPAEIERYFIDRERLREAGANADELRALSERYGVGDTIQSQSVEPAYVSSPGVRLDGVVVTGRSTRDAYALAERVALPEHEHVHADQEEAFYVISGTLFVEIDGETLTAPARSFVLAPRGVRRRHIAAPGASLLTIFSPGHTVPHDPSGRF